MTRPEPRHFVFDTNILVSAVLFRNSTPGRALREALARGTLLASTATLDELAEVLSRDKLDRYVSEEERKEFYAALIAEAWIVEPIHSVRACRDPKDDKFLELALEGAADLIVTGDQDLLSLNPFRGVGILSASDFLSALEPRDHSTP